MFRLRLVHIYLCITELFTTVFFTRQICPFDQQSSLTPLIAGLTGEDRSVVDVLIKHAAPRYMSLALEGYTLLLLDFVHASTIVLNSTDIGPNVSFIGPSYYMNIYESVFIFQCPRTEAVTFLASLLSLPESLLDAPMLQPYAQQYTTVMCPDLKVCLMKFLYNRLVVLQIRFPLGTCT